MHCENPRTLPMDYNVYMDYCVYTVLLNNRNFCEASDQNSNLFNAPFPFPAPVSSSSLTNAKASLPADDTDDDIAGAYRPHSISRPRSLSSAVSAVPSTTFAHAWAPATSPVRRKCRCASARERTRSFISVREGFRGLDLGSRD